jgi:hypothetical protein
MNGISPVCSANGNASNLFFQPEEPSINTDIAQFPEEITYRTVYTPNRLL